MSHPPLLMELYETAYVVRDMDAALSALERRDGVGQFLVFAPPATRGPVSHIARVAKAFVGARMIELIQPNLSVTSMFEGYLPQSDDALRFHHLGYLVRDDAHWDAVHAMARDQDIRIAYEGFIPDMIRSVFLDMRPQLGHFCEYIQNYAGGIDLLGRIPRN